MDKQKGSAVAVDDKAKKDEAKYDQIAQKELQETNLLLQQFEISLKRGYNNDLISIFCLKPNVYASMFIYLQNLSEVA